MPRPSKMLKVERFSVIQVITDRRWKIEKTDASREVSPSGRQMRHAERVKTTRKA
jgi:hypothetical protein